MGQSLAMLQKWKKADLVSEVMWGINVRDGSNMIPKLRAMGEG